MIDQIATTEATVPLGQIRPGRYQHRQTFKPGPLLELAGSIRQNGLIQPPLVYRENGHYEVPGRYELLAGERRWRAMCALAVADHRLSLEQAIGVFSVQPPSPDRWPALVQATIPVRVCQAGDPAILQTVAAVENLQREDLTPLEEAHDFASLRDLGHSTQAIARLTGKAWQYVKGMLDWLDLEPEIQVLLDQGLLCKDFRVSAALLAVSDPALRLRLARQFADRRSPIRAIVAVCERAKGWPVEQPAALPVSSAVPVRQVVVESAPAPAPPPPPPPCLCPACAVKIHEVAEELCGGCRERGLTAECLKCDAVAEVLNRLISLSEAAYA